MGLLSAIPMVCRRRGGDARLCGDVASRPSKLGLTMVGDTVGVLIMVLAGAVMLANAITRPASERIFWALMVLAFVLWAINQWGWAYYDVVLRLPIPDPYFADIVLFFHVVPMIAAMAWRADHYAERIAAASQHAEFHDAAGVVGVSLCLHRISAPVRGVEH